MNETEDALANGNDGGDEGRDEEEDECVDDHARMNGSSCVSMDLIILFFLFLFPNAFLLVLMKTILIGMDLI
ncbi:MAG: hypothetical protein EZS28_009548 [Streblomastix strix]|uniref:Uncharacterized protein n=1 Tax=Streblomastix strix TaxID=222440 RepID=A0A5J4WIJ1_9EUKA|nr:MAG: hypothetical protein EZS28_009548 [Streblomastix strix]